MPLSTSLFFPIANNLIIFVFHWLHEISLQWKIYVIINSLQVNIPFRGSHEWVARERRGKSKGREGEGKGERFKPESLSLPLVALPLLVCSCAALLHLPRNGELAHRVFNQQLITLPHSTIVAAQFILTLPFIRNRGYYMVAQRYEISLQVLKRTLVKYIFNTRREISYFQVAM